MRFLERVGSHLNFLLHHGRVSLVHRRDGSIRYRFCRIMGFARVARREDRQSGYQWEKSHTIDKARPVPDARIHDRRAPRTFVYLTASWMSKRVTLPSRTDHVPLARPVLAERLAAMDVATIHTVGPGDIIGQPGQHAVYIPRIKAIVEALQEFDIKVLRFSHWFHSRVRPLPNNK